MKKLTPILFIVLGACYIATAQLQVDKQLQMTGASNPEKQITGVGNPGAADHAVNAGNVQAGSLIYAGATGSVGNYVVVLSPVPSAYTAGMVVNFVANHDNTVSGATLKVNALSAVSIKKGVSNDLEANDITIGQVVSVMYDGANFQLLSSAGSSGKRTPCYTCDGW